MMEFRYVHKNLEGDVEEEIVFSIEEEGPLHEVMQAFRRFLLAVSYHPSNVDKYIEDD